jgi:nucleoside-triphosphatase THEP1
MLWLLAGEVNSGKSTLALSLAELLRTESQLKVGGIITPSTISHNVKSGYYCVDLVSGEQCEFATLGMNRKNPDDVICGQWTILGKGIEFARRAITDGITSDVDLMVVDEFGIIERDGGGLRLQIDNAVASSPNTMIIVRKSLVDYVCDVYKGYFPVVMEVCQTKNIRDLSLYKWFVTQAK